MAAHRLEVVPFPEDARGQGLSYIAPRFPGPVIIGTSTEDYACGHCGEVILAKVAPGQVPNLAVKCFACGTCNRTNAIPTHSRS